MRTTAFLSPGGGGSLIADKVIGGSGLIFAGQCAGGQYDSSDDITVKGNIFSNNTERNNVESWWGGRAHRLRQPSSAATASGTANLETSTTAGGRLHPHRRHDRRSPLCGPGKQGLHPPTRQRLQG
jgi:hypothetical protein